MVTNPTGIHEDVGLIPGLTQWVKVPELLWLWWRLAATVLVWPLAWELPYALGAALKRPKNKKTKKQNKTKQNKKLLFLDCQRCILFHAKFFMCIMTCMLSALYCMPMNSNNQLLLFFFFFFFFLRLYQWHMEVSRPGTESELELQPTLQVQQQWTFNPLLGTGDWTQASATTQATAVGFLTHCATVGTPTFILSRLLSSTISRDFSHIGEMRKCLWLWFYGNFGKNKVYRQVIFKSLNQEATDMRRDDSFQNL